MGKNTEKIIESKVSVKIDMYNCKLNFIVSNNINDTIVKICKKNKVDGIDNVEVEGILLYFNISEYYLIIDSDYLSHNTIAHEVYHAVIKVTEERDITDEESQAWLAGYITESIYKFIKNKNIIVK